MEVEACQKKNILFVYTRYVKMKKNLLTAGWTRCRKPT